MKQCLQITAGLNVGKFTRERPEDNDLMSMSLIIPNYYKFNQRNFYFFENNWEYKIIDKEFAFVINIWQNENHFKIK